MGKWNQWEEEAGNDGDGQEGVAVAPRKKKEPKQSKSLGPRDQTGIQQQMIEELLGMEKLKGQKDLLGRMADKLKNPDARLKAGELSNLCQWYVTHCGEGSLYFTFAQNVIRGNVAVQAASRASQVKSN